MKKTLVVLLLCVLAGSLAFAKPKAKDYPIQFTVESSMDSPQGCYMDVTDGDGSTYEIHADHKLFGLDCPTWSAGVTVQGRFKHWPGAGTNVVFFYYVPQKNKPNKAVTFWFDLLRVYK